MTEYVLTRADLGYLTLGIVFVAMGLITLLLTILRSASRDGAIFLFGAMSGVWGIRFLLYTELVPLLLTDNPQSLQPLARSFTYFGAAAVFGFAFTYLGAGRRSSLRGLAYVSLAFACLASLVLLVNPDRDLLLPVFSVLIILGAVAVIANLLHRDLRRQPDLRGFVVGISISGLFFILENLRALNILSIPFDVEWMGVVILYITLGRIIAVRLFTNEQRLAAIRQELATARQIQASLLPGQTPQIPGLTVVARYVPMTEVAGDIYDFVEVDEYRQGILVADVSGHGVPAALIASMVKGAFRAQIKNISRPELVLAGMNQILTGQLNREFVTASITFIDMERGILRYSGAGHPPLLIQSNNKDKCVSLQENGLLMGQFTEASYSSVDRPLTSGDRLVVYTDGILEATNDKDQDFGEDSLHDFLARHRQLPADDFADSLVAAICAWTSPKCDESLEDDLTLVVIDIT